MTEETTPRKRGRPRKEKPPKGPRRKPGPSSGWDERLGGTEARRVRLPVLLHEKLKDSTDKEFRRKLSELMLDN